MPNVLKAEFSKELQLILASCEFTSNKDKTEKILYLLQQNIDWNKFLILTDHHRLDPVVYHNLKNLHLNGIPDHIFIDLKNMHIHHTFRMMKLSAELIQWLKKFDKNNIKALPLKGPVLTLQIYKNIHLRRSNDLDILVSPSDFNKAESLLESDGYRLGSPFCNLTGKKRAFIQRHSVHLPYTNRNKQIRIELHWSPSKDPFFGIQSIWSHLIKIRFAGYTIPALDRNDIFLYSCQHGSRHNWHRLFWLQDVAIQLSDNVGLPEMWPDLFNIAKDRGLERYVAEAVLLSHHLFETDVPEVVRTYSDKNRAVRQLICLSSKFINSPSYFTNQNPFFKIKRMSLASRSKKKPLAFVWERFVPSPGDFNFINLPDKLFFMYYILHPFFVLQRKWRALKKLGA